MLSVLEELLRNEKLARYIARCHAVNPDDKECHCSLCAGRYKAISDYRQELLRLIEDQPNAKNA